ncbi:hypothetical protein ACHAP5_010319 [Fusarium lateritium]
MDRLPRQDTQPEYQPGDAVQPPSDALFTTFIKPTFQKPRVSNLPGKPRDTKRGEADVRRPQDLMRKGVEGATWDWWSWYLHEQEKGGQKCKEWGSQKRAGMEEEE